MKRLSFLLLALVLVLLCVFSVDVAVRHDLRENADKAIYLNDIKTRNTSDYMMDLIIDDSSIVVLGSSELSAADELAYPPSLFNNGNSNYNMILMGAGYLQGVPQAVNVGALQNNIKNGKVVLILSPQWFSESGLTSDAYCSRFEEANYIEFLKNANISAATKTAVSNRMEVLLASDPATLQRVKQYNAIYLHHSLNPVSYAKLWAYEAFINAKTRFELARELDNLEEVGGSLVEAENLDFDALKQQAFTVGEEECTNNSFGVYDDYYDTYLREDIEGLKGSKESETFAVSPEYDDFRLFLDVCKETGIEPLIISMPVNGRWYDYTKHSKADRNTYYQNIRNICSEYDVKLVDYSDREYELYFLKDVMHMGWKGWVHLDRDVYSFFRGEEITDDIQYELALGDKESLSDGVTKQNDGSYMFTTNENSDPFNSVQVTVAETGEILDSYNGEGVRRGTYLHTAESGEYTLQIIAQTASSEKEISYQVSLEKDAVYRISYRISNFEAGSIDIEDLCFEEVEF